MQRLDSSLPLGRFLYMFREERGRENGEGLRDLGSRGSNPAGEREMARVVKQGHKNEIVLFTYFTKETPSFSQRFPTFTKMCRTFSHFGIWVYFAFW